MNSNIFNSIAGPASEPLSNRVAVDVATTGLDSVESPIHQWFEILESPDYFLHVVDARSGNFGFIRTSRERLANASFVDGRSPLAVDSKIWQVPIDEAFKWQKTAFRSTQPNRFVFHQSFCGSTFLARALHVEEKSFAYKEPNIVAQLANLKAAHHPLYANKAHWSQLLNFVLEQFKQSWLTLSPAVNESDHQNLIKPSSWVNTMLPDLATEAGHSNIVLVSQSAEDFLVSVFRGGGERVQFAYALLKHLRSAFPDYYQVISEIEQSALDSADLFIRLTLIAHALQNRAFAQLQALLPARECMTLPYQELQKDPVESAYHAARTLQLGLEKSDLVASVAHNLGQHAKVSHRGYAQQQTDAINAQVRAHYQENFKAAMDWYQDHLLPSSPLFEG
ncbi:MAG: hypothetical protein AAF431_13735 [Pseudomonadota bacterium]